MIFAIHNLLVLYLLLSAKYGEGREDPSTECSSNETFQPRIWNGENAPVGRFPYMCSLRERGNRKHRCGGTLIHPRWVLTAAHCVDPKLKRTVGVQPVIYCGIHEIDEDTPELTFAAVDAVIHPRWKRKRVEKGYDIAMLKLDRKTNLTLPGILSIETELGSGIRFAALGWGRTNCSYLSKTLQMARDLVFVPAGICDCGGLDVVDDIMICAGLGPQNTCEGDSGGPLLLADAPNDRVEDGRPILDLIVGITSFGRGLCGDGESLLGMYTHAGYFTQWIQNVISGKPFPSPSGGEEQMEDGEETTPTAKNTSVVKESLASDVAPEVDATASITEMNLDVDFEPVGDLFGELTDEELLQEMISALEEDDSEKVAAVLDAGLDPNTRYNSSSNNSTVQTGNTADNTLLHWAARYNASDSAWVLLDYGAIAENRNLVNNTPLHYSGIYDSPSVAEALLENGADVNSTDRSEWTALHFAAQEGHIEVAKVLLSHGANADAFEDQGLAPLHFASRYNHPDVVEVLLMNGADVNSTEPNGMTALHLAAQNGYVEVTRVLLSFGADVDALEDRGLSPLHLTALVGHSDVAEMLLENGADVSSTMPNQWTALHLAARHGHVEVARVLLSYGADVDALKYQGLTPLHVAALLGHSNVSEILLENGADVNSRRPDGMTALHLAALQEHVEVVNVLLLNGAGVNIKDRYQQTPLHLAVWHAHVEVVEVLLSSGADLTAVEDEGLTPLHFAAIRGHANITEILLDNGASVTAQAFDRQTALHRATSAGHLDVAQILVDAGASKYVRDDDGNRPVDVVCDTAETPCSEATRMALVDLLSV